MIKNVNKSTNVLRVSDLRVRITIHFITILAVLRSCDLFRKLRNILQKPITNMSTFEE